MRDREYIDDGDFVAGEHLLTTYELDLYPIWSGVNESDVRLINAEWLSLHEKEMLIERYSNGGLGGGYIRPHVEKSISLRDGRRYFVTARFTLNDGTQCRGLISPALLRASNDAPPTPRKHFNVAYHAPRLFLPGGMISIGMWGGQVPTPNLGNVYHRLMRHDESNRLLLYRTFMKSPQDIFPIQYEADPGLIEDRDADVAGMIPGFCYVDGSDAVVVAS